MVKFLPNAAGNGSPLSTIDAFLTGQPILNSKRGPIFDDISTEVFSKRLSMLLDTLWQISLAPTVAVNSKITKSQVLFMNSPQNYIEQAFVTNNATAAIQTPISVYATSRHWALMLLILTSVLQVCAAMGLLFKFLTIAPDILGYVSTLTWHNPFTTVPAGGTTLDGLSRARGLKVQVIDIQSQNNQRGHIAFVSVGNIGQLPGGRVKKGRVYD